jgi:hypothetical protein
MDIFIPDKQPFNEDILTTVLNTRGYSLYDVPDEYLNFLRKYNAGETIRTMEGVKGSVHFHKEGKEFGVSRFYGYSTRKDSTQEVRYIFFLQSGHQFGDDRTVYIPCNFFPVAGDGLGNDFFVSLSRIDKGAIYFWDHEEAGFEDTPFEYATEKVADSFSDFLDHLEFVGTEEYFNREDVKKKTEEAKKRNEEMRLKNFIKSQQNFTKGYEAIKVHFTKGEQKTIETSFKKKDYASVAKTIIPAIRRERCTISQELFEIIVAYAMSVNPPMYEYMRLKILVENEKNT